MRKQNGPQCPHTRYDILVNLNSRSVKVNMTFMNF